MAEIGRWRGMAPEASLYEGTYYGQSGCTDRRRNHSFVMS